MLLGYSVFASAQSSPGTAHFPYPEKLTYLVEWRLINAGVATVQLSRGGANTWNFGVQIESAGLVSRLYRVLDSYKVTANDRLALVNATLDAQEGKKHSLSKLSVDNSGRKLSYEEHDVARNTSEKKNLDIAPGTFEIVGALAALRTLSLEPGHSTTLPVSDGKKFAQVRLAAQSREKISVAGKNYQAIRYEAFLFDNVLYRRRGRLLVWVSDDPDHLPVQFRMLLGFPLGSITISLQKQEH
jgi:Protein of unknown function (DUF3108)